MFLVVLIVVLKFQLFMIKLRFLIFNIIRFGPIGVSRQLIREFMVTWRNFMTV